jgi:hypothetical protein
MVGAAHTKPEEAAMTDVLSKFDSGDLIGLVAVAGVVLCGLVCGTLGIILGFYTKAQEARQTELMCALKQDMLNRGMSADEIRTVLDAGSRASRNAADGRPAYMA